MAIFAVTALPVCLLGVVSGLFPTSASWKRLLIPFGAGVLSFLPAYLVHSILDSLITVRYEPASLYLNVFIPDALALSVLGLTLYFLFFGWPREDERTTDRFLQAYGFLSGLFSLVMVAEVIRNASYLSMYLLYLQPLLYVSVSAALPLLVLSALDTFGFRAALYVAGAVVLLPVIATAGLLFQLNRPAVAVLVAAVIFLTTIASVVGFRLRS
jgi:hypothetical protein